MVSGPETEDPTSSDSTVTASLSAPRANKGLDRFGEEQHSNRRAGVALLQRYELTLQIKVVGEAVWVSVLVGEREGKSDIVTQPLHVGVCRRKPQERKKRSRD